MLPSDLWPLLCVSVSGVQRGLGDGRHVRGPVRARPGRVQTLPLLREREEGDRGALERKPHHPQVQAGELLLLRASGNSGLPGDVTTLVPTHSGRAACFKITLLLVLAPTGRSRRALPARCRLLRHSGGKRLQFGADESKFLWVKLHFLSPQVRNSLGLAEENEDEDRGGGVNNSSLARLLGKKLKNREMSYSRAELASLWALLQQEEYTFLR